MEVNSTVELRRLSLSTVPSPSYQASEYSEDALSPDSATSRNMEPPAYSRAPPVTQLPGRGYSTTLHRSLNVFPLTLLYAALAIYAWVAIVYLSFRPMSAKSWRAYLEDHFYYPTSLDYVPNEGIYRSAVVIRTLIIIITLPWLSAVCASAAVIYVQNQKSANSLRMRQVTNLADRRWLDITLYKALVSGGWKKHGSTFLVLAIILHLIAGLTYPIQSIFLETKTIRVPESINRVATIGDFASLGYFQAATSLIGNDILTARRALSDANADTFQPFLWQNISGIQLPTLNAILSLNDSFYAQLPNGFNTGVVRQFAPRVNSTATYETITASEFPNCESVTGAFYSKYYSEHMVYSRLESWGVTACMPANLTISPWQMTRDRQDFSETLYLNFTLSAESSSDTPSGGKLYRITANTTAGYFEWPNYMNEGLPGPLLEKDPVSLCGVDCPYQTSDYYTSTKRMRRDNITTTDALDAAAWDPIATVNKGPLLTTALAMFGPGSFLDTFAAKHSALTDSFNTANFTGHICLAVPPLLNLMLDIPYGSYPQEYCLDALVGLGYAGNNADSLIQLWLGYLLKAEDQFPMIFTAAAFLSNKQMLESAPGKWWIHQDLGAEMNIPTISSAGIIVGSVLMALYIIPLLGLAFYAAYYPRWTERLDSFVMLRFGAAIGDKLLPLRVARTPDQIPVLDEIPGVVRDVSIPDGDILPMGTLGLGDGQPLRRHRRYEAFQESDEPLTQTERRTLQS